MSSRTRNDVAEGHIVPPISPLDGPLLRPEEAAALLSVKTSWVYDAVRTGKLPCLRVGPHIGLRGQCLRSGSNHLARNSVVFR
jgi:excisionase family DNA binding protein